MESSKQIRNRRDLKFDGSLLWLGLLAAFLASSAFLGTSPAAAAESPPTLWTRCAISSEVDTSCQIPRGLGTSPSSGHVFVADSFNYRVVEFTALGAFLQTWGWDVVASGPGNKSTSPEPAQFEICVPADGDTCKAGVEGTGAGQFGTFGPQGIALDSVGNIYVVDFSNHRVEKFDSEGHFVLSFGSDGAGNGQFSWPNTFVGSFITIDSKGTETTADDNVYVGDVNRIQRFNTEGVYQSEISLPGKTVQSLTTDSAGNFYVIYHNQVDVRKLTPAGEELSSPRFEVKTPDENAAVPSAVAVDSVGHVYAFGPTSFGGGFKIDPIFEFEADGSLIANFGKEESFNGSTGLATNLCPGDAPPGNLYVSNASGSGAFVRAYGPEPKNCGKAITGEASSITETAARLNGRANPKGLPATECFFEYGISQSYGNTVPCTPGPGEIGAGTDPVPVHGDIGSLAAGSTYHFRLVVGTASGTEAGADGVFKTLGPPVLSAESATRVAYTEATLKALVNPEGFSTKYHFEYGLDTTYGSSTPEIDIGSDRSEHSALANLAGLTPGAVYHWRAVASNSSGTTKGPDHVFTTFLQPEANEACSNQAFRVGTAANLPDCRAYEMVSPVDKNGGDIVHILRQGGYVQTASDGEKLTYSTTPAFGDVLASLPINQYLASRDPEDGWLNHGIHPPVGNGKPVPEIEFGLAREFEAFSADLCSAWFLDLLIPSLTPKGQDGYMNHYRLDLCGEQGPEALTTVEPPVGTARDYVNLGGQSVAGYSQDSRHALFAARAKLTPDAATGTNAQVYDFFGGEPHLVSIRPNGVADTSISAVGSGPSYNLRHAVSRDGSRVYWTSFAPGGDASGLGRIFLREHPEQGKVEGECTEPAKACTVAVTLNSAAITAFFWAAAVDGSGALFGEPEENGEKLVEFDLKRSEEDPKTARRTIAKGVSGVFGASDDLSRIYFVSKDTLTPGQKNSEGDEAEAGEPNLYLDEGGTLTYIATLIDGDVGEGSFEEALAYDVVSNIPYTRASRVTPDGTHIAFQSRADLTGFDNTDPANGEANVEVFTYEAGGALRCVSCNPSGARPSGPELREPYFRINSAETDVFATAWIQTWEHPLYASHVLSDDGSRLFFHSYEALAPSDTNGAMDVYEWEAPGAGGCTEKSHAFHAPNGGCLYLISSGESSFESEFWDADVDGDNVFFSTESSLVPRDTGLIDLYDARVEGGFPEPTTPARCEGEACQSPPPPPRFSTPSSGAYTGSPNPPKGKPCPKGKRKVRRGGKTRCVKRRKGGEKQRRASGNRRAAR